MAEIQKTRPEILETPEIQGAPPFQAGDVVMARQPKEMTKIINRPFAQLVFGKSQPKVISITWYEDQFIKCWAIELSNCKQGDFFNADNFELVPEEAQHSPKINPGKIYPQ
jgi:hypothetical protein